MSVPGRMLPNMTENHLERMLAALRDGSGWVELDAFYAEGSSSYQVARENAVRASEANEKGERRAFLFTADFNARLAPQRPRPALSATVTFEEARQLLVAGAKWVGPAHSTPK